MPKASRGASENGKASKDPYILCPFTDEKVFITTLTLSDIRKGPTKKRKELLRLTSKKERLEVYEESAMAISTREEQTLPLHGGRPWKVIVKMTEPARFTKNCKSPLFRWFRGGLELAVLPHLLEKIPEPMKRATEEEEYVPATCLQERAVSSLSEVAWNDREHAIPVVTTKWLSPNHQYFYSRKAAWEHAEQLMKDDVFCNKVLRGIGARGQLLKPKKPTKRQALEAGKKKFLRDGLWVVGQEESWQEERQRQVDAENREEELLQQAGSKCESVEGSPLEEEDSKVQPRRRRMTGLRYFIRCKREEFRKTKLAEMRAKAVVKNEAVAKENQREELSGRTVPLQTGSIVPGESQSLSTETGVARPEISCASHTATLEQPTCSTAGPAVPSQKLPKKDPCQLRLATAETDTLNTKASVSALEHASTVTGTNTMKTSAAKPLAPTEQPTTTTTTTTTEPVVQKAAQVRYTLADADKELRNIWKTVDSEEQKEWDDKARQYEANLEESADEKSGDSVQATKPSSRPRSPLECYIRSRRETYREQKLTELKASSSDSEQPVRFTLADAEKELRVVWKALTDEEKEEWKENAPRESGMDIKGGEASETGVLTPPVSDSELEASKEVAKLPAAASNSGALDKSQVAAVAPLQEPVVAVVARSSANVDSDVIRVSPSPPLEPPIEDHTHATTTAKQTQVFSANQPTTSKAVVKRKRHSSLGAARSFVPSQHWRLPTPLIELCYNAVMDHYHKVMYTVKARALFSELADGFDLLRERGRGRYDMELPIFDTPDFSFLTDVEKTPWMPIVRQILGQDVILIHKGAFLSMPGAETQVYHQDGPHLTDRYQRPCHAINVFIPLVDLSSRNGPTEFCLGTHILGHEDFVRERTETPMVPDGTPIIFDYRLGHRGLGNSSPSCRPIVYCTYAAAANGKEFRDSVNFSRKRYHKIGDLVALPPSREERAKKRRLSQEEAKSAEEA